MIRLRHNEGRANKNKRERRGEIIMELTKKNLKELSESLGAYYCGGNVYNHENIQYYIRHKDIESVSKYINNEYNDVQALVTLLNELLVGNKDNYTISDTQLAYSHGIYGNNGQIHKYTIYNNDREIVREIYTYYC